MLKHKGTYEIIAPEDIGYERTNEAGIVLGKLRYAELVYAKVSILILVQSGIYTSEYIDQILHSLCLLPLFQIIFIGGCLVLFH